MSDRAGQYMQIPDSSGSDSNRAAALARDLERFSKASALMRRTRGTQVRNPAPNHGATSSGPEPPCLPSDLVEGGQVQTASIDSFKVPVDQSVPFRLQIQVNADASVYWNTDDLDKDRLLVSLRMARDWIDETARRLIHNMEV